MPGQLGRATALLAAIVLFLAALPILTMITMSFSAADTLEFPPHAYQPALVSRGVAQLRLAGCERLAVDGRRVDARA